MYKYNLIAKDSNKGTYILIYQSLLSPNPVFRDNHCVHLEACVLTFLYAMHVSFFFYVLKCIHVYITFIQYPNELFCIYCSKINIF